MTHEKVVRFTRRGLDFARRPHLPRCLIAYGTVRKRITGSGNRILYRGGAIIQTRFEITGHDNLIDLQQAGGVTATRVLVLGNRNRLAIRNNVRLGQCLLWLEGEGCTIEIGENTTIEGAHLAATENTSIRLGSDCMLAYGIEVRSGDSHSVLDQLTGKRLNQARNVTIEDHVWIAADVKVLKGVTIGTGSIVATGAVVTKSIPPGCLAAGVPARVVKTGVCWVREHL